MNIASLKQEYRLQQQANSSSNEEGMNEAGELDDDDIDDEDLDDEEEDEGEDSVGDEEEEASQHSLCEYFHNNTHLAPGAKGAFPTPNGSALHHRDGYQQQKHSMDFASAGAFHHSSHTYEAAQASNVSSGGLGINRKRAFSFAASTSNDAPHHQMLANIAANANAANASGAQHGAAGEKRAATKICRVCGDKAYSYNFNVITCESCKAFFRRNANKEKVGCWPGSMEISGDYWGLFSGNTLPLQRAVRHQHSVEAILPALQVTEMLPCWNEKGMGSF